LNHRHIGTEHLLLGLLRSESCFAAQLLVERGAVLAELRARIEKEPEQPFDLVRSGLPTDRSRDSATIEIHGAPLNATQIHHAVKRCR
jgi:hypothetical protein